MATTLSKSHSISSLTDEVTEMYGKLTTDASADELEHLMSNSNVESFAQVYDTLVRQNYTPEPESPTIGSRKRPGLSIRRNSLNALIQEHQSTSESISSESLASTPMDSYELDIINGNKIRSLENNNQMSGEEQIIRIAKHPDEPLGMTVKEENGQIEVARILVGSRVDKENLLHVGDVILSVNGKEVKTPETFISTVRQATGIMEFRVIPSYSQQTVPETKMECYLRALFTYDPSQDTLLPCNEIGLSFVSGEVIEVLNREDQNWWQARRLTEPDSPVGLIPSQELEEMRRAFVPPEFDYSTKITICGTRASRKKKKEMYQLQQYSEFDKAELQLYEEVCRMPPFERKTLVLIGAQGVGRRTLKARLIAYDPDRFAAPLPHTSRPIKDCEVDGKQYHFVKREIMEKEIANGKYLESGELQGHLYGIKLDSIRTIIRSAKMCIIDCNPQCLKLLKTKEFLPFVVFIAAPAIEQLRYMHEWGRARGSLARSQTFDRAFSRSSRRGQSVASYASFYDDEDLYATIDESERLCRLYETQFDLLLPNNNFETTFEELRAAIDSLSTEPQWVPISWLNSE